MTYLRRSSDSLIFSPFELLALSAASAADLPPGVGGTYRTYRSMLVDGREVEFTEGFTDLKDASLEKARSAQPLIEDPRMRAEVRGALTPKDTGIREAPLPFDERK